MGDEIYKYDQKLCNRNHIGEIIYKKLLDHENPKHEKFERFGSSHKTAKRKCAEYTKHQMKCLQDEYDNSQNLVNDKNHTKDKKNSLTLLNPLQYLAYLEYVHYKQMHISRNSDIQNRLQKAEDKINKLTSKVQN